MSRTVILILIYHRHKHISNNHYHTLIQKHYEYVAITL
jgi:hypothetical protein